MVDILYAEKSDLLAQPVHSILKDFSMERNRDGKGLLKDISRLHPRVLIIGDSLNGPLEKWVLYLKEILPQLQIVFLGENERMNLLPLDAFFPRFQQEEEEAGDRIRRWLDSHTAGAQVPLKARFRSGSTGTSFDVAREALLGQIRRGYMAGELEALPVTDTSMEGLMDSLLERILFLLGSDFCALSLDSGHRHYRKVYINRLYEESTRNRVKELCEEAIAEAKGAEWIIAMPPQVRMAPPGEWKIEIGLKESLGKDSEDKQGTLLAGVCKSRPVNLDFQDKDIWSETCSNILKYSMEYYSRQEESSTIYRAFSHFLPGPIIDDLLLKASEKELMTGEKRSIAVLFSHIRDFDGIIERNEPQQIVEFLNRHFTAMGRIIQNHGGVIDKFIGDAIFAVFGAPISYEDNARRAAAAAKEMIETYKKTSMGAISLPPEGFFIGVGLNQGQAIIGNIGCNVKFDYTAIGDTINLAARLESLCKHYRKDVLISESVMKDLDQSFVSRLVDIAAVKGKNEASLIYSLEVFEESYSPEWFSCYKKGISMYRMGNWTLALKYLNQALELNPEDFPTRQLISRCETYREEPPENWDGSVVLDFK